ncbi:MAG TPA: hypothetical protein VIS96_17785 [Terrimicrobiaceae bacterium]
MSAPAFVDRIWNWRRVITKIPFLGVIILALIMQVTKEFYPFSHYPMYSDLPPSVEYYYLTTGKGEPIPQVRFFGFSTSWTKKMLNSRLKKIAGGRSIDDATPAQIKEAGQETLQYLMDHCKAHKKAQLLAEGLQLHCVFVERSGNRLLRKPSVVAELPGQ